MKRIRIGKDIVLRWRILTNGEAVSLRDRVLKLMLHHSFMPEQEIQFSIDQTEDNKIVAIFRGVSHKTTGEYRLTLWENYGLDGQTAVDYCNAFELVDTTCEEGGDDAEGLDTETVDLEDSDLEAGIAGLPGMSAYELFKKYNPDSPITEQEYAEAPVDAAKEAETAIRDIKDTNRIITDAENARVEAEDSRVDAESKRVEAETDRVNAESARRQAERNRDEAEGLRVSAENTRISNEDSRIQSEIERDNNETERTGAESKREAAESLREIAEAKRESQEKSRKDAEALRVSAENNRVNAENNRVIAEDERVEAEQEREQSVDQALTDMSDAISNAESATSSANNAADTANTAAESADEAAARAAALADNPPKIVEVEGVQYWAFYNEETKQYVTSDNRADGVPLYASFYVDPATMDLFAVYPKGYGDGPAFSLENGDLLVTINE